MAYIGAQPNKQLTKTTSQSFNGTGSATAFTLNRAVNTGEELEVFVDNVQQEPGSGKSYTATGTTLTFDEAPPSGTGNVYVIYRGQAEVTTRLEHDANQALSATTGTFTSLNVPTIKDSSGSNTAITIDSSGRVFKPAIPFFVLLGGNEADKTVANLETLGATNDGQTAFLSSGTIAGIRGFTYTSTTGVITVPVDGLYHIGANIYSNESGTSLIALYQNSTIIQYVQQDLIGNATMDIVANLSSGDELSFRNVAGSDKVIYEGKAHTQVYGFLVG